MFYRIDFPQTLNLKFIPTTRKPFSMAVSVYDTIREIKEKIQKYRSILPEKQTLIYENRVLPDDFNFFFSEMGGGDCIQLIISGDQESAPPPENPNTVIVNQESTPPPERPTAVIVNQELTFSPKNPSAVTVNQESSPPPTKLTAMATATPSKKITLVLKMASAAITGMKIELRVTDSVRRLKEKINGVDSGLLFWNLVVRSNGVELHDHKTLHECGLLDNSEIEISIKRSAPACNSYIRNDKNPKNPRLPKVPKFPSIFPNATTNTSTMDTNNSKNKNTKEPNTRKVTKRLKIMVLPFKGKKKVVVEVNATDNVEELRKELEKVNETEPLNLSKEGFFFLYKLAVMEEDRSFQWHKVRKGDTINIINGTNNSKNKNPKKPKIPKVTRRLKIMVLPFKGKKKVAVEVNATDNVEELRNELDKVNETEPLNLSKEGFFFLHKLAVMEEDRSFQWHKVRQGDTINIINGTFTKGS